MKKVKLGKIIKGLRDNPGIMSSSDIYAAARDRGLEDSEAREVVGNIVGDMKIFMVCSSYFRAGYSRALIDVERKADDQAFMEIQGERRRRAKELFDILPDFDDKDKLRSSIEDVIEGIDYGIV